MAKVKFGDMVRDVKINIDRSANPYQFYVAGDHMDSEDLTIRRKGCFATDDVGPAFIRIFNPQQVLYGSRRTYLKKVAVANFEGITANTTFVLETKDENILCQRLLPFLMLTDGFTQWSIKKSKGSTNPYVLFSDLADYEFELPPIEKQHELANLLWAAYELKESYKKLLAATDEMVKAKFMEMFGSIADNTYDLPIKKLSDVAKYSIGLIYKPESISDTGIIVLRSGNIQDGVLDLSDVVRVKMKIKNEQFVSPKDILMCSRNGSANLVGKTAMISEPKEPMSYGAFMTLIRSDIPEYLLYFFRSESFRKQISYGKSSTMNQITQKMLDSITLQVPKDTNQFSVFSNLVHQADASKAELKSAIEKLDRVMQSLLP